MLIRNEFNEIVELAVEVEGDDPVELRRVRFSLEGTDDPRDVASLEFRAASPKSGAAPGKLLGTIGISGRIAEFHVFTPKVEIISADAKDQRGSGFHVRHDGPPGIDWARRADPGRTFSAQHDSEETYSTREVEEWRLQWLLGIVSEFRTFGPRGGRERAGHRSPRFIQQG